MSVLCQKALSINVAAPCVFIQDTANDSLGIKGLAYSPERQEVLAVSGTTGALYPINALTRIGGTKVVMTTFAKGVAWCPSVLKYYITLNNNTVVGYNPATFTFDAALPTPALPQGIVYAPTTDRVYCIAGGEFLMQINPHTNTIAQVFDGGGVDDYGYQIAYAPSINAIVGRLVQAGSLFGWIFSLPGNTMGLTPNVAATAGSTAEGATWDSTRGKIWMSLHNTGSHIDSFIRVDPVAGNEFVAQLGATLNVFYLTYDATSDAIYFNELTQAANFVMGQYRTSPSGFHQLNDPLFLYGFNTPVLIVGSLFFNASQKIAGSVNAVRSCAVSQFT